MNVTKHTKYIWQIDNFLPDDEIDYFLNAVGFYNPTVKSDFRNDSRQNDTYDLTDVAELDGIAWNWVRQANQYYVSNNKFLFYNWEKDALFSDNTVWRGQNILRQYNDTDSYDWHADQSPANHAEFSYIIYLNDDFDGGETRFMNPRVSVKPTKGSVLCFPVDHYHIHKGVKVTNGTKKILWNCVYRNEIKVVAEQPYLTAINAPRSSTRCIW